MPESETTGTGSVTITEPEWFAPTPNFLLVVPRGTTVEAPLLVRAYQGSRGTVYWQRVETIVVDDKDWRDLNLGIGVQIDA